MTDLATVLAFDPGGTTGWCAMGVKPEVLNGANNSADTLQSNLEVFKYGQIDCGTKHGETGEGMNRGHGALNLPGENYGVFKMTELAIGEYYDSAIVIEDFILQRSESSRELLSPVRITSSFSFCIWEFSETSESNRFDRMFLQNRSPVKTTCTDERLKRWKLYDRSSGPHARDATRHAFYFLRDCRGSNMEAKQKRHIAWPHLYEDPNATGKLGSSARNNSSRTRNHGGNAKGERINL